MSLEINRGLRNARIIAAAREFEALRTAHELAMASLAVELERGGMRREDVFLAADEHELACAGIDWRKK